ncbi:MAG: LytTR family transcriptional regulator [Bradyrhizobium sp.]|uniref:LytTR family DNA-binding domain-containing protein n=1 Tax=Bradyrhizobium sp. TaxID=376 RepID=UPI001D59033B|nr:LytTR family DNA-binding domain-containing protein [Bradyrhizobium sp.]MBV9566389.1 LytTR family transcriptional regulator [Bradyrhizobium sp.]
MAELTGGDKVRLSAVAVYAIVTILIAISCTVNTFSNARDISWRLGAPHNLWEPALWELTSGIVVAALTPLARYGAILIRGGTHRLLHAVFGNAALLVTYSALHIAGMGLLRELAYRGSGFAYSYPWAQEALYEFRKDVFAYAAIAVVFWLAERPTATPARTASIETDVACDAPAAAPELWLRDGRLSILANPNEIVWVGSAGNYVEFRLVGGRTHLVRATLQTQEERLTPFGFVRVHRSRLVNPRRIVALEWRSSGDFELRLDTGETIAGSRRFKAAVAGIAS